MATAIQANVIIYDVNPRGPRAVQGCWTQDQCRCLNVKYANIKTHFTTKKTYKPRK